MRADRLQQQHAGSSSGALPDLEAQAAAQEPWYLAPTVAVLQAAEGTFVMVASDARRLVHKRYRFLSYVTDIEGALLSASACFACLSSRAATRHIAHRRSALLCASSIRDMTRLLERACNHRGKPTSG